MSIKQEYEEPYYASTCFLCGSHIKPGHECSEANEIICNLCADAKKYFLCFDCGCLIKSGDEKEHENNIYCENHYEDIIHENLRNGE
jgi:hypothetical protein